MCNTNKQNLGLFSEPHRLSRINISLSIPNLLRQVTIIRSMGGRLSRLDLTTIEQFWSNVHFGHTTKGTELNKV